MQVVFRTDTVSRETFCVDLHVDTCELGTIENVYGTSWILDRTRLIASGWNSRWKIAGLTLADLNKLFTTLADHSEHLTERISLLTVQAGFYRELAHDSTWLSLPEHDPARSDVSRETIQPDVSRETIQEFTCNNCELAVVYSTENHMFVHRTSGLVQCAIEPPVAEPRHFMDVEH